MLKAHGYFMGFSADQGAGQSNFRVMVDGKLLLLSIKRKIVFVSIAIVNFLLSLAFGSVF